MTEVSNLGVPEQDRTEVVPDPVTNEEEASCFEAEMAADNTSNAQNTPTVTSEPETEPVISQSPTVRSSDTNPATGGSDNGVPASQTNTVSSLDEAISAADATATGGSDAQSINDGHINTASQTETTAYVNNLGALADNADAGEHATAGQNNLLDMGNRLGLTKGEAQTWTEFSGQITSDPAFMAMIAEMDPDGSGRIGLDDARETGGAIGLETVGPGADTFNSWDQHAADTGTANTAENFHNWITTGEAGLDQDAVNNATADQELWMDTWRNAYTEVGSNGAAADSDFSNHAEELTGSSAVVNAIATQTTNALRNQSIDEAEDDEDATGALSGLDRAGLARRISAESVTADNFDQQLDFLLAEGDGIDGSEKDGRISDEELRILDDEGLIEIADDEIGKGLLRYTKMLSQKRC